MIRLEIQPYCDNCLNFDPDVKEPQRFYCGSDAVSQTDTVIRCSHRNECERLLRYLKNATKEEIEHGRDL